MKEPLAIKPHHFVDILVEAGRGGLPFKPHPHGHALHSVAGRVMNEPALRLVITIGPDAICAPCRRNADGACVDGMPDRYTAHAGVPSAKEEWNRRIDVRWCAALGVSQGEETTPVQLCDLLLQACPKVRSIYRELPGSFGRRKRRDLEAGIRLLQRKTKSY